jgi:hypothetical protein
MPWPLSPEQLVETLARTDRHIAHIAESIERQQRLLAELEGRGRGNSETAKTLRALLVSMQKAEALYVRDRERIKRLIADRNREQT